MSLLLISPAFGDTELYEPFDYAAGAFGGQNGGIGWGGAWINTRNAPTAATPGFGWGALIVEGISARGAAWSGVKRSAGTSLTDASLLDDGATLWFAVIFDLTGQNGSNADLNLALCNANQFESGDFGNKQNLIPESAEGIGISHQGGTVIGCYWQDAGNTNGISERTTAASSLSIGNTNALIVGKIEWGADSNANETLTLYAPDLELEQGAPILEPWSIPALDQSTFNIVALQFKDTPRQDEIRFGATYDDVAVPPPPQGTVITLY